MKKNVLMITMCILCSPVFADTMSFTGQVDKGELYEQKINDDLIFRLVPNSAGNPPGWVIMIVPVDRSREDYVWVVTPPYRFSNPQYVDISYGISAREAVNHSPRTFSFVTNEKDFKTAGEAVDVLLWPSTYTKREVKEAKARLEAVPRAKGIFTITDASFKSVSGGKEEIEHLAFQIELDPVGEK